MTRRSAPPYCEIELMVGGKRIRDYRATIDILNPATDEVIGTCPRATAEDLDGALAAVDTAFRAWRHTSAADRAGVLTRAAVLLRERADEIAAWITAEQGKTFLDARGEVLYSADIFVWNAGEAVRVYGRIIPPRMPGERLMVLKEPIGPVAAFTPWNFPVYQPAAKIAPALAAGCPVILKPSEETPAGALALARALFDAGLPPGMLNIVFGDPVQISRHLIGSPIIRKVSLTGSVEVGREIARLAATHLQKVTLELGGHAPVIVCGDADPEAVASLSARHKFRNAGQVCVSGSRFLVHSSIYEPFVAAFARQTATLKIGDGMDRDTDIGPLANKRRVKAVELLIDDAMAQGSRMVHGGKRIVGAGNFFEPTVLADVPPATRIMRQEPFGPVAAIRSFETLDEALSIANGTEYGLAAYAFTASSETAERLMNEIEAGMVLINSFGAMYPETPFGGIKASGYGSENGPEGIEGFLTTKFAALSRPAGQND